MYLRDQIISPNVFCNESKTGVSPESTTPEVKVPGNGYSQFINFSLSYHIMTYYSFELLYNILYYTETSYLKSPFQFS